MTTITFNDPKSALGQINQAIKMADIRTNNKYVTIAGQGQATEISASGLSWYRCLLPNTVASDDAVWAIEAGKLVKMVGDSEPKMMTLEITKDSIDGVLQYQASTFEFNMPVPSIYVDGIHPPDDLPEDWYAELAPVLIKMAAAGAIDQQNTFVMDGRAATWLQGGGQFIAAGHCNYDGPLMAMLKGSLKNLTRDHEIGFTKNHVWARTGDSIMATPLSGSDQVGRLFDRITGNLLENEIEHVMTVNGRGFVSSLNGVRYFAQAKGAENTIAKFHTEGGVLTVSSPATEGGRGQATVNVLEGPYVDGDLFVSLEQLASAASQIEGDMHVSLWTDSNDRKFVFLHDDHRSVVFSMGSFSEDAFRKLGEVINAAKEKDNFAAQITF